MNSIVDGRGLYLLKIFRYTHEKQARHHETRVKTKPWGCLRGQKGNFADQEAQKELLQRHIDDIRDCKLIN